MTDNEIIKDLERYISEITELGGGSFSGAIFAKEILDLINRLKAELDESREKNAGLALALLHEVVNEDEQLRNEITKVAKSEAYKEFVTKAEEKATNLKDCTGTEVVFTVDDLYDLLKEMG